MNTKSSLALASLIVCAVAACNSDVLVLSARPGSVIPGDSGALGLPDGSTKLPDSGSSQLPDSGVTSVPSPPCVALDQSLLLPATGDLACISETCLMQYDRGGRPIKKLVDGSMTIGRLLGARDGEVFFTASDTSAEAFNGEAIYSYTIAPAAGGRELQFRYALPKGSNFNSVAATYTASTFYVGFVEHNWSGTRDTFHQRAIALQRRAPSSALAPIVFADVPTSKAGIAILGIEIQGQHGYMYTTDNIFRADVTLANPTFQNYVTAEPGTISAIALSDTHLFWSQNERSTGTLNVNRVELIAATPPQVILPITQPSTIGRYAHLSYDSARNSLLVNDGTRLTEIATPSARSFPSRVVRTEPLAPTDERPLFGVAGSSSSLYAGFVGRICGTSVNGPVYGLWMINLDSGSLGWADPFASTVDVPSIRGVSGVEFRDGTSLFGVARKP